MRLKRHLTRLAWFLPIIALPFVMMASSAFFLEYVWIAYLVLWVLINTVIDVRRAKRWLLHLFLRSLLAVVLFGVLPFAAFISLKPTMLSLFNAPLDPRAELRHALNLESLPSSVTNLHIGDDIWTDYIVHIYCELDPADFPAMISAVPFEKDVLKKPYMISPPDYAPMPLFTAEETYYIRGEDLTMCMIWTTKEHGRMYVYYGAD